MDYSNLCRQAASMKKSLFDQGYLDEQFCQVEDLQDEASPNFAEEVVTLFFKDSARLISNVEQALEKYPKDFNRWDAYMQQLKGSCSSIGASRMKSECMSFRDYCGQGNVEGSLHEIIPESEEGARCPEAETRGLFPAATTSWSCWSCHQAWDVRTRSCRKTEYGPRRYLTTTNCWTSGPGAQQLWASIRSETRGDMHGLGIKL